MTVKVRNEYHLFLIKILNISDMDEVFALGQKFANLETELGRTPTTWEVVSAY